MKSFEQGNEMFKSIESDEKAEKRDVLVGKVASTAHDAWREPRKIKGTNTYEPRLKTTADERWIRAHHGKTDVDIANTPYAELPEDWQKENRESAEIAVNEVLDAVMQDLPFDDAFVERVANLLHQGWIERNKDWASEELKKPYAELSEEEKEKDRYFVRNAIRAYKENME